MTLPKFTMRELLEAGVHFGHRSSRWNPKMKPFIFGKRNGVHILDLQQTVPMLYNALGLVQQSVAQGGKVLFVGTKRQAQDIVVEAAERSGQYYVNHRWLGGMLTNWKTISASIKRLKDLEAMFAKEGTEESEMTHLTKKERLMLEREFNKLQRALGGIKDMGGIPDVIVVIDTNKEKLAVQDANTLGLPVIGILDSNSDPAGVDFPVPGNDDATRAIRLYCRLIADAVLEGMKQQVARAGSQSPSAKSASKTQRKTVVKLSPKAAEAADKAESKDDAAEKQATAKKADAEEKAAPAPKKAEAKAEAAANS